MLTVLMYVVVMVVVGAVLFFIASAVFGRSETLAPIPPGTTATVLPAADVTGTDVLDLRFQQTWRGYKMSEVDWALDRLAREIDDLRAQLAVAAIDPEAGPEPKAEVGPDPETEPVSEVESAGAGPDDSPTEAPTVRTPTDTPAADNREAP